MLIAIYCILSAIVCALIDWYRIKSVHGEVENISKSWTVFLGGLICFIGYGIFHKDPQFFIDFIIQLLLFCLLFASIRGSLYDISLNVFRKRKIDYESTKTNSKFDKKEQKWKLSFWQQRAIYSCLSVLFWIAYDKI